jgi:2-iminobutanoate/2-iminopropanoate deaminase
MSFQERSCEERFGSFDDLRSEATRASNRVFGSTNLHGRRVIRTPNAASPPLAYSQAIRAEGLVFVSGTRPQAPITGKIVGIWSKRRQCLENVSAILKAAGTSLERVVSAPVILLEETDFAGMNEEWIRWFPVNPPARQGAKLPIRIPGFRISIAVIAVAQAFGREHPQKSKWLLEELPRRITMVFYAGNA